MINQLRLNGTLDAVRRAWRGAAVMPSHPPQVAGEAVPRAHSKCYRVLPVRHSLLGLPGRHRQGFPSLSEWGPQSFLVSGTMAA